jgi:malate dehydrogenase (oxaloacetate-decarboxylating)
MWQYWSLQDHVMKVVSPSYSLTIRLRYPDNPGLLGRITSVIGGAGGSIGAVDIVDVRGTAITRDFTVNTSDVEHGDAIVKLLKDKGEVDVLKVSDRTFLMHLGGKIEVTSRIPVKTRDDLSMAYTPGVARVCRAIYEDPDAAFNLTIKRNTVAVVTDGTAVLGMGDIGPRAAMPVMEGKALLFKEFAGVDAFPLCLDTKDPEKIIETCKLIAPTFGGINLEDISSPRCVEIERRLHDELDIPVFHDDQHGTAIVVLAALTNALKVVDKKPENIRVAMSGAGAAGMAIARLLGLAGVQQIVVCDRTGAIYKGRAERMNPVKDWLAENTNPNAEAGSLGDIMRGADVLIGVSAAGLVSVDNVKSMANDAIVFALANPDPEITPEDAEPYARVMATGRSDYPNQCNNVLCFPGLFRGLLDVRAHSVTDTMKLAAAVAIASVIGEDELHPDYIIPSVFNRKVAPAVASAVAEAAIQAGVARRANEQTS